MNLVFVFWMVLIGYLIKVESLNAWAEWVKAPTDGNDTF